jgi:hypothetical protein
MLFTLQAPIRQILEAAGSHDDKIPYSSSLIRGKDAVAIAVDLMQALVSKGAMLRLDPTSFSLPTKTTRLIDLPRYICKLQI